LIDLAFSKKRADDRKEWLRGYQSGTYVDYNVDTMLMSDFIQKELILFSRADNVRSIPSMVDGLKPAQRKVLFACFKRNLKTDIKVAQLAGYVSEHAAYHHGEAALAGTIVGMAQNFVGSNNINLLVPSGQFGTRLMGGKDAASARYIFTRLQPITRAIFHPDDDALLDYMDDDGQAIEPVHYLPVIPLVLVNGSEGIGTGWSSYAPNYNPRDVIEAVTARVEGRAIPDMVPWYRGFQGSLVRKDGSSFTASGCASVNSTGDMLDITELPIKRWTQDYKNTLVEMITGESAKDTDEKKGGNKAGKGKSSAPKLATTAKTGAAKAPAKKTAAKAPATAAADDGKKPRAKKVVKKAAIHDDSDMSEAASEEDDDEFDFEGSESESDDVFDEEEIEEKPKAKGTCIIPCLAFHIAPTCMCVKSAFDCSSKEGSGAPCTRGCAPCERVC
jgi:hypothetical protein